MEYYLNFQFRFNGESVHEAKSTIFPHKRGNLANYRGRPFTTGSRYLYHAKTEIMNLDNGEWKSGPDYPFYSS